MSAVRTLYRLHKWLGLGVAAWLVLAVLTGMLWTIRDAAETPVDSHGATWGLCLKGAGTMAWRRTLRAAGEKVVRIDARDDAFRLLRVSVTDPHGVRRVRHVDQCSGSVLPASDGWEVFMSAVIWVHGVLVPGPVGKQLIGLLGVLSTSLVIVGVCLWWLRGGGSLRTALTISPRQGIARLRSWHQVCGALAAVPLVLFVASGTMLAYSLWLVDRPSLGSQCAARGEIRDLNPYLDELLRTVRERVPDGAVRTLRLDAGNCVARIYIQSLSVTPDSLHDRLWIDLRSLQVVAHSRGVEATVAHRAWAWASVIHSGELFGPAGWLLTLIAGVVLLGLSVTGVSAYFWSKKNAESSSGTADSRTDALMFKCHI